MGANTNTQIHKYKHTMLKAIAQPDSYTSPRCRGGGQHKSDICRLANTNTQIHKYKHTMLKAIAQPDSYTSPRCRGGGHHVPQHDPDQSTNLIYADWQIQIQKYKYKNTNTKIQIHKYKNTRWWSARSAARSSPIHKSDICRCGPRLLHA